MNEIVKVDQTNTAIAIADDIDPFEAYADLVAPSYIVGKLLRFDKGDYIAGEAKELINPGTQMIAALDELLAGWIKWQNSKPIEHIMTRVADRAALPKRAQLGNDNPDEWELGADGKSRDPWAFTNYLPLMQMDNGELYTFATSSKGGIQSIGNLSRRYGLHRKRHPEVFPLIALGVGSYKHKDPQRGRIKFPDFAPTGYVEKKQFYEALEAAGIVTAASLALAAKDAPAALIADKKEDGAPIEPVGSRDEPPPVESEDEFADEIPWR
jgi:hypothetical protein